MSRALAEQSTEREVGHLMYRDDQLERRVMDAGGELPWCVRHFEGEWDFDTYPLGEWTWDWMDVTVDPAYFWTNDDTVFTVDNDYIQAGPGVYLVTMRCRMHAADFHLDLSPAAGTTRIFPGHCQTYLEIDWGFYNVEELFSWSTEDQVLSAHVSALGVQYMSLAATVPVPNPPTVVDGLRFNIITADAFITGAMAPPAPPSIDGFMHVTRLTSTGYP